MKTSASIYKAYTLIEILVSLVIIGILFGVGFISFRDFQRRQALVSTARSLIGSLKKAQENALSGKKPDVGCTILNGYKVEISTSESKTYAVCDGSKVDDSLEKNTFPSGITLSSPPSNVTFRVLANGTDLSGDLSLVLIQKGTGKTLTVTITSAGKIE